MVEYLGRKKQEEWEDGRGFVARGSIATNLYTVPDSNEMDEERG